MEKCLSEQSFRVLLNGSATAEQVTKWKRHLRECDTCAAQYIRLQANHTESAGATTAELNSQMGHHVGYPTVGGLSQPQADGRLEPNIRIGDFVIEKRIGSGGMGTVYQACQTSLNRHVALKVMSAGMLTTPEAVERFHREARAAAKLHHNNIVAIYAEGQDGQTCYYAMELVDGSTVDNIIRRLKADREIKFKVALPDEFFTFESQTPPAGSKGGDKKSKTTLGQTESACEHYDWIAGLVADVADALDYAHKNGVIHRDVKPSNLILGNNGRINLMDFGLARMLEEQNVTVTGTFIGTPNYMSPEQVGATKHKIDHRTDIYSLGVTLYELLTLQTPFEGETRQQIVTQILTKEAVRPRKIDRRIPRDLETICCKAMEKEPQQRYQSAGELAEDLRRFINHYVITAKRAGPIERVTKLVRRHKVLSALTSVIAVLTIIAVLAGWKYFTYQWVQRTAIPEISRLINEGSLQQALVKAQQAQHFAPHDPQIEALFTEFTSRVNIATMPPGADIYIKPYNMPQSEWKKLGKSPVYDIRMALGMYWWRIEKQGYETLERRSSLQSVICFSLEQKGITPEGMVLVEGEEEYNVTLIGLSKFVLTLPDFYIDRYEVTNKQFKEFVDGGGYKNEKYWKQPIIKDGKQISWSQAMGEFCDSTGRPGPSAWSNGDYPSGRDNYPVEGVSWYEAAAYAEFAGKQLPTVYHWSKAGVIGGNYGGTVLLSSNFSEQSVAPVGYYQSFGDYGTYDMAGNVREWCWNEAVEGTKYILGGAWSDPQYTFASSIWAVPFDRSPGNGFRCMKNKPGTTISKKACDSIISQARDYSKETPVSDEEFQIYVNLLYSYNKSDLNQIAHICKDETEYCVHQVATFDAAYGNERMDAHLYLPKNTSPPYQVVIYFPGSAALFLDKYTSGVPLQFLLRSGRAVLLPIYKGTFERRTGLPTIRPDTSEAYKNHVIWWTKDLCRSIDYLELREDIQHDKIAFYGLSWGADMGAIIPAVEKRLTTAVLVGGAFYCESARPEVDQINFAGHVKIPVLMLNGQYDGIYPVETAQNPLFNLFGTPAKDKQHILIKEGHLPKLKINEETLIWLDRYLGPVETH
jgi:eukaryotic-like serine/threonine-protein kinase